MIEYPTEQFFEACGGDGGFSVIVANEATQKQFRRDFSLPFAIVGRNPDADLGLFDQRISWRHTYLQVIAGRLLCLDLQSRTGTYWASGPGESGWLDDELGVRIGPFHLRAAEPLPGASVSDSKKLLTRLSGAESLPRVTLEFGRVLIPDRISGRTWELDRVLTLVGNASMCKVRFPDQSVSSFHCSLLRFPQGIWVVDLLSREGTLVNGQRRRWAALKDGDELQIGKFLIRFHFDLPPAAHPATSSSMRLTGKPEAAIPLTGQREPPGATSPDSQVFSSSRGEAPGGRQQEAPPDAAQAAEAYMQSLVPSPFGSHGDFWKGIIAPLFQQFSQMHQQMFEQFQGTLMMVVQMLNAQQREQFDLVREELDRIRDLNKELATLQTELARSRAGDQTATGPSAAPAPETATPGENHAAPPSPAKPAPRKASSRRRLLEDAYSLQETDLVPEDKPPVPQGAAPPVKQGPSAPEPPAAKPATMPSNAPKSAPKPEPALDEVHQLISERLKVLQEERQSLWQRVMKKLTGEK
jgi:pSer/pThr/pTyr-binding forkhead associated (FHA) protein